jgi:hypothetical protein
MGPVDHASPTERLTPGDIVLRAGDALFAEADVAYAAWNAGDAPAVVTVVTLARSDEPSPSI